MAENVARTTDRVILIARFNMPGSFQAGRGLHGLRYGFIMRVSTIAKHRDAGSGSPFARALGSEVRRRRQALGLSQSTIGEPLSRAFLSSVETGRTVPSLPSLLMIARRLNTSAASILAAVERQLEGETGIGTADQTAIPRSG